MNLTLDALRRGDFDEAKLRMQNGSLTLSEGQNRTDRLRSLTLQAEIYDHFGDFSAARSVLRPESAAVERSVEGKLNHRISLESSREDWKRLQQELYFMLQQAVSAYREDDYHEAERLVGVCSKAVERMDPVPQGLIAQIHYASGRLFCQMRQFARGAQMFRSSFRNTHERMMRKQLSLTGDRLALERAATDHSMGKSLALGVGYCLLEQGLLQEALTVLTAGRMLLMSTPDRMHLSYANLLMAVALRTEVGDCHREPHRMERAELLIREAEDFFQSTSRTGVLYRILYEKGLLKMYSGDLEKATALFLEAATTKRRRWKIACNLALARLKRRKGELDDALRIASREYAEASEIDQPASMLQALWILALIRTELATATETSAERRELFHQARKHVRQIQRDADPSDAKFKALALLQMAKIAVLDGDREEAERCLAQYEPMASHVQYGRVLSFAQEVRGLVHQTAFRCPADAANGSLDLKTNQDALEAYLVSVAEKTFGTMSVAERAAKLGISRGQYYRLKGRARKSTL